MKVEMTFSDDTVSSNGYAKADIYQTIKKAFISRGLRCSSDDEVLAFEDSGQENDYAYMWQVILSLLKSGWFVKCASSCTFFDDDGLEEDVLSQAWKVNRRMA